MPPLLVFSLSFPEYHKRKTRIFGEVHGRPRVSVEPEGRLADRAEVRLNDEKNSPVFLRYEGEEERKQKNNKIYRNEHFYCFRVLL